MQPVHDFAKPMALYDAFISYSHARDKPVAAALQTVLQKLGKPWYRRRALRIFRDDTSLAATPELWPSIEQALGQSRYLIVLASPQLAASHWCGLEVAYWLEHKSIDTLLIALTEGDLTWDRPQNDFNWNETTPLPPSLKGRLRSEPKWIDLRTHRETPDARDAHLIDSGADFAATIHGMPKEDLLSQEVRQQKRALRLAWAAATALALLTAGAGWQWWEAETARRLATVQRELAVKERDRAQTNFSIALTNIETVLFGVIQKVNDARGVQPQTVREVLEIAQKMVDDLSKADPESPYLQRSRAGMLTQFVNVYLRLGDLKLALEAAEGSLAIIRRLAALRPDNMVWQGDLGISLEKLGNVREAMGDGAAALAAYEESLVVRRKLVAAAPNWKAGQQQTTTSLGRIGDLQLEAGNLAAAQAAYEEALAIMRKLLAGEPDSASWQRGVSRALGGIGDVRRASGDVAGALAAYEKGLVLLRTIVAREPDDRRASDLAIWLDKLGDMHLQKGDSQAALAVYEESLAVRRRLAASEPGEPKWQIHLVVSLYKVSTAAVPNRARALLVEAVALAEKLVREGHLKGDQEKWPGIMREALAKLPPAEGG